MEDWMALCRKYPRHSMADFDEFVKLKLEQFRRIVSLKSGQFAASMNLMGHRSIADEEMFTADQRFMNNKFKGPLDNVAADTRTNEAKAIEAQKPGRSNRVATKIVEFDQEFNVKSYTLNKSSKEAFKVEHLDEYKPVFNSKK